MVSLSSPYQFNFSLCLSLSLRSRRRRRRRRNQTTMSDYLPKDIIFEILSRLPVKSLLRFTGVCKLWYSLITNPNFISTHLNQTIENTPTSNNHLMFIRHYNMFQGIERYALHFDNDTFDEHLELEFPIRTANEYFRIVGCCNGLICLSDDYDSYTDTIVIWNPSIRKSVTLPKPKFNYVPQCVCYLGFGFDPLGNNYKVVRIVYLPENRNYKVPPNVELYSLSTGTWRDICDVAPPYLVGNFFSLSAFLNGAVHWIATGEGVKGNRGNFISVFDMGLERFREIMMPESLSNTEELKLCVSVMDTKIAVTQYQKIWQSEYCRVWMMKDYGVLESWTKLFTIDMRGGIRQVMGFRRNDEVLVSARVRGLISYDPKSQHFKYLGIHGSNRSFYACAYVESLVLLKGESRVMRGENYDDVVSYEREMELLRLEDVVKDHENR